MSGEEFPVWPEQRGFWIAATRHNHVSVNGSRLRPAQLQIFFDADTKVAEFE